MQTPPPPIQPTPGYYSEGPPPKKPFPVVWVVLGVVALCGCGGVAVLAAILFPVFAQAKQAAIRTACLTNVKQMSVGLTMYSQDFDEKLPLGKWMTNTADYRKNDDFLTCPALASKGESYGYTFEKAVLGKNINKLPEKTIMIFESTDFQKDAVGSANTGYPNRHGNGRNVAYSDGYSRWIKSGLDD